MKKLEKINKKLLNKLFISNIKNEQTSINTISGNSGTGKSYLAIFFCYQIWKELNKPIKKLFETIPMWNSVLNEDAIENIDLCIKNKIPFHIAHEGLFIANSYRTTTNASLEFLGTVLTTRGAMPIQFFYICQYEPLIPNYIRSMRLYTFMMNRQKKKFFSRIFRTKQSLNYNNIMESKIGISRGITLGKDEIIGLETTVSKTDDNKEIFNLFDEVDKHDKERKEKKRKEIISNRNKSKNKSKD